MTTHSSKGGGRRENQFSFVGILCLVSFLLARLRGSSSLDFVCLPCLLQMVLHKQVCLQQKALTEDALCLVDHWWHVRVLLRQLEHRGTPWRGCTWASFSELRAVSVLMLALPPSVNSGMKS